MILFILIICLLFFILLFLRAVIKQSRYRKNWLQRKRIFEKLYANINSIEISKNDRAELKIDYYGLVYGEICFDSFATMLEVAQPNVTDIFYDLGSGSGKAVSCSAMLYKWKKCCGIELLPGLYQASMDQLNKINSAPEFKQCFQTDSIQFIHDNFLEIDITDATIIFINATSFTEECWRLIVNKLNTLQSGVRIIVTSKKLNVSRYKLLDANMYWMDWGWCSVYIYQKKY